MSNNEERVLGLDAWVAPKFAVCLHCYKIDDKFDEVASSRVQLRQMVEKEHELTEGERERERLREGEIEGERRERERERETSKETRKQKDRGRQ